MGHLFDRRQFLWALGAGAAGLAAERARAFEDAKTATVEEIAGDPDRPEYHFLAPHNWMNDPNGPIWWKGKYHLFYQLNPGAAIWGDMHWGHATSTDMVRWKHLPIALAPTPGGPDADGCFTGSAVVDKGVPTLIYTGVVKTPRSDATLNDGSGDKYRETQLLAVAEDDTLEHWKKLPEPVIAAPPAGMKATGFRDPCPWREGDTWYVGIGSGERGKGGCVLLYKSADLRHWEYLHPLVEGKPTGRNDANPVSSGEMWECPDFFEIHGKHCLLYSAEDQVRWSTGDYDAKEHKFTPTRSGILDHGAYYAPKNFVAPDGRRILWGWITEKRPVAEHARAGWAGATSLPRVLTIGAQGQLEMRPAAEVESLRGAGEKAEVKAGAAFRKKLDTLRHEFFLHVPLLKHSVVKVRLLVNGSAKWELALDVPGNQVRCGAIEFPLPGEPWPRPELRMFLDGSIIESFIGGRETLTSRVYGLKPGETELEIAVSGDRAIEVEHWALAAISNNRMTA